MKAMTGQGNLKCYVCGAVKEHKCQLMKHIYKEHGASQTCNLCSINISKGVIHKCIICEAEFVCQCQVMKHLHELHQVSDTCKFCGEQFTNVTQLLAHRKLIDETVDTHPCDFCGEVFQHKCQQKKHLETLHKCKS